jgi:iron complex outermembrane receptor protein
MTRLKSYWLTGSALALVVTSAYAKTFTIAPGDLDAALNVYQTQSGVMLVVADNAIRGVRTTGVEGDFTADQALIRLLKGTGFTYARDQSGVVAIVPQQPKPVERIAQAAPPRTSAPPPPQSSIETVVVTAQHKSENIQQVPIAITALSQQQLTERQIAGGPDLVKEVPNLTFSKTNFTGYNLEIRGIGTQAISVTTDPAVAVAFNDTPFIRNHFFEQEFYDLGDLEVLRGPQGTLYGRNATAGVVNIKSALPTDQYEAMLSADFGNYSNRRLEGMLNLPIVGDTLDLRIAGEWTKRDGYDTDAILNTSVDGRDLWSGRVTLGWKPASNVQAYLIWEHFSENDDRLRSAKQLCKTAPIPTSVDGVPLPTQAGTYGALPNYLSQGCEDTSLYSPSAFEVPNGYTLGYGSDLQADGAPIQSPFNVYAGATQSTNLRDVEAAVLPQYRAKNDTLELNADWAISKALTFSSQTGFNQDFLWSTEDYDRFDSAPGIFSVLPPLTSPDPNGPVIGGQPSGIFCDPQLGCSDRLVVQDLSTERSWQLSQELRLASNFSGPVNFNIGGNVLHYETLEDYYVFINTLTSFDALHSVYYTNSWIPGVSNNAPCLLGGYRYTNFTTAPVQPDVQNCSYIDPNPLSNVNGEGHNYFLSENPYVLNSYAAFGEVYYNITHDLKLTTGLRFTDDQKHFDVIPSELLIPGYGYPETGQTNQQWAELTGREVIDWTPHLSFTDASLFYASYAHGYKAGGANPPGALFGTIQGNNNLGILTPIHPLTFKPEYIEAFEAGTKNTLLDGGLTLNGDIFYYNYSNYQISEIVDRTAINNNYNAHVEGAEFEGNWEPLPGLKFSLAQGFESTSLAGGDQGIDLMDRTAGNPNWMVVKPSIAVASNCILPTYVVAAALEVNSHGEELCSSAYVAHIDPITGLPYVPNPTVAGDCASCSIPTFPPGYTGPNPYPGFNPLTAPNNGEGFDKQLGGNQLPNAPHFTTSLTAEYTMPVSDNWAATLHGDFYWQSQQWARVFEDPIDKIHGYSTTNVSLILTSANGWQVMAYVKNVFDVTAITGTFLNSDDTSLTTNVFLTDPRLFGLRVTKQLDQNDGFWGSDYSGNDFFTGLFSDADNGKPPLWIEFGGQFAVLDNSQQKLALPFTPDYSGGQSPLQADKLPHFGFDEDATISYQPAESDWVFSGGIQFGRSNSFVHQHLQTNNKLIPQNWSLPTFGVHETQPLYPSEHVKFADTQTNQSESHAIIDFLIGKDVGLGMFGLPGSSVVSGGVRVAQFISKQNINLHAEPDVQYPTAPITSFAQKYQLDGHAGIRFHDYAQTESRKESFHGLGPKLDWKASTPVAGDEQEGMLNFDWGASAAILFGRQKMAEHHQTVVKSYYLDKERASDNGKGLGIQAINFTNPALNCQSNHTLCPPTNQHTNPAAHARSRMVAVPNIGAFAGISWRYRNAKVSFGYRADEFFGAMDGGVDERKTYNQGFFGPFANISIGLGG